jgi:hypothetical protein
MVEIAGHHGYRICPSGEVLFRSKRAVALAQENGDRVFPRIYNRNVRLAVPVEVGHDR